MGGGGHKDVGPRPTFSGIKIAVVVPLSVFSLKRPTAQGFAVSFRVLSRKKNMIGDNVLF